MSDNSKVRLELYASKLKNVAGAFKGTSDPYAVVTLLANDPKEQPRVLGKTEVIKNSLSPKWTTFFDIPYTLGCLTRINIGIYDEVRKGTHKPMGAAMFEVGEVLGARGNTKAKNLRKGGTLFARITAAPKTGGGGLQLTLRGVQIKNVDGLFGKSDPFFEISAKLSAAGGLTWQPVYRSKPVMNNLNPTWEPFSLDLDRLCEGDRNKPILFKLYDWQKNGKHVTIGSFETNVNAILGAQVGGADVDPKRVDVSKAFHVMKRGKIFGGKIVVVAASIYDEAKPISPVPVSTMSAPSAAAQIPSFSQALDAPPVSYNAAPPAPSPAFVPAVPLESMVPLAPLPPPIAPPKQKPQFVDYLAGGLELELCIAIDFTGSNGDPRKPGTLHYIHHDGQLNDYEKAITSVGSIVGRYDANQKFPVWGFGAKYGGAIQHCFQVGGNSELDGISGVLEGYRNVFRTGLTMSGPTVFAEVIGLAAAKAQSAQEQSRRIGKQSYVILLILTDGAVSDVNLTKHAIESASDAPLSIVIVGIGSADFSAMKFLDDLHVVRNGKSRDICQFVEFSKYANNKKDLTRETLAEIPDQLVEYFYSRDIMPLPPQSGSQLSLTVSDADEQDIELNMDFGPDGEISLANYEGAVYDDTKYGTTSSFIATAPCQPSAPYPPSNPVAPTPYQPSSNSQPSGHQSYQPAGGYVQSPPAHYQPPPQTYNPHAASTYNAPSQHHPIVQASQNRLFHVQAPSGSYPGMQLQVQNPYTGQMMLVAVPQGVMPGGTFGVRY